MGAVFGMPKAPAIPAPPEVPTLDDAKVQQAAEEAQRGRTQGGRASQILTNPQRQQENSPDARRYLGGF